MKNLKFSDEMHALILKTEKNFSDWDHIASVRAKKNMYQLDFDSLQRQLSQKDWFLSQPIEVLSHPELANLGREQRQHISGCFLLQFLDFTVLIEHEYVNLLIADIAFGKCGYVLPCSMRRNALKIYTDEAYHALFSLEATQYIREYLHLSNNEVWPLKNQRIDDLNLLIDSVPLEDKFLVRFGIAVVAETTTAKELSAMMSSVIVKPIVNLLADHADDEKKHCLYFCVLCELVWGQLTENEKIRLGNYFPQIFKCFFGRNPRPIHDALLNVGVAKENVAKVISESSVKNLYLARTKIFSDVTFRLLKKLKIFDYPGVRQSFINERFPVEMTI